MPVFWCPELDRIARIILALGVFVQLLTAYSSVGTFNSDQHFQIVEFAGRELGTTPAEKLTWEYDERIRPAVQVYGLIGWYRAWEALGLRNPYTILMLLRVAMGLAGFYLFIALLRDEFRRTDRLLIHTLLLIACFSWTFPFVRTLYSAEVFSGLLFFAGLRPLKKRVEKSRPFPRLAAFGLGVLLAVVFFVRFQMAFALLGLGFWLLLQKPMPWRTILWLGLGFVLGLGLNTGLDSLYYGTFTFTPYRYFDVNILQGKAAAFGTSSPLYYLAELALLIGVPLISLLFFYYFLRGCWARRGDLYVLVFLAFLIGHMMVGHKEERFLFPVFFVLPVLTGYGLEAARGGRWAFRRIIGHWGGKLLAGFSALLALPVLVFLMFVPYSQIIYFTKVLHDEFRDSPEPVCITGWKRSPYESPSGLSLSFYDYHRPEQLRVVKADTRAEWSACPDYLMLTYDELVELPPGTLTNCRQVTSSSSFLLAVNRRLHTWDLPLIPDVWVLYRCE
jgi:phosphatidylinositol glycan class B